MHIWLYTYISAGPCLSGATRLRRICCKLTVPSPSNHFNHRLTIKFSIHFQSFPVLQSATSSLPVWYQPLTVCKSAIWCLVTVYCRPGRRVFASPGWVASTWIPPGYPWKIITFPACLQDPQKPEKVPPRSPKVTKKAPKTIPGDTKFVKK